MLLISIHVLAVNGNELIRSVLKKKQNSSYSLNFDLRSNHM